MDVTVGDPVTAPERRENPRSGAPLASPCTVFPALVIGVGGFGERVVRRLARQLRAEDPRLLEVVRAAVLSWDGTVVDLDIVWNGDGAAESARVNEKDPLAALARDGDLAPRLQRLCDTVGVHEQMQRLAEQGYTTFLEDADIQIRAYLIGNLSEPRVAESMAAVSDMLPDLTRRRGKLVRTSLCVAPDESAPRMPGAERAGCECVYLTSPIKEHGYLVSGPEELETAHSLFLQSLLLSGAETLIAESDPPPNGINTFGIASLRLGTPEMADWLAARLALRVIEEGYLGEPPEMERGAEGRTGEARLYARWGDAVRSLGSRQLSVRVSDDGAAVLLPDDSPLSAWCSRQVDERAAGLPAPQSGSAEMPDSVEAAAPLSALLTATRERALLMEEEMRADMRDWVRDDHLAILPGPLQRAEDVLRQWRDALEQQIQTCAPAAQSKKESEGDLAAWLDGEIDRIGLELHSVSPPAALTAMCALAALGALGGGMSWLFLSNSPALFIVGIVLLIVFGALWRWIMEFKRHRLRARLMRELLAQLESRLEARLHAELYGVASRLVAWVSRTETEVAETRSTLQEMAARYREMGDEPRAVGGSFLEEVVLAPERCRGWYAQVGLEALFATPQLQALAGRAMFPAPDAENQNGIDSVRANELERILFDGVERGAAPQFAALRSISLADLAPHRDPQVLADSRDGTGWARTIELLRERALPLHRLDSQALDQGKNGASRVDHLSLDGIDIAGRQRVNMLLVADRETECAAAAAVHASSPDYLKLVPFAGNRAVVYVRAVYGISSLTASAPKTAY